MTPMCARKPRAAPGMLPASASAVIEEKMLDGFNLGWIDFEDEANERMAGTTGYRAVLDELVRRAT